jgi:hypothetical protein
LGLLDQIIMAESGGDPTAKNPRSSAEGLGQFIDGTWLEVLSKHRPDLVEGKSRQEILSLKTDPTISRQMTEAYATDNAAVLTNAGLPVTPGTTYLAHFAGPKGAVSLLTADPATPASSVLGAGAVSANPFLRNMTVGDLKTWAERKVGQGAKPTTSSAASPDVSNVAMAAPMSMAPSAVTPEQTQPAQMQAEPDVAFGSMTPMQQPPPLDLLKLARLRARPMRRAFS